MWARCLLGAASALHVSHTPLSVSSRSMLQQPVMVDSWFDCGTRLTGSKATEQEQLDAAFATWHKEQHSQAELQSEVNRLVHPDVPLWLVFENIAQPLVLPGSVTTDYLHNEAARLHNLDVKQRLKFQLGCTTLPLGIPISASPLARSRNLEVRVVPCDWPVKRGFANPSSSTSPTTVTVTRPGPEPWSFDAHPPLVSPSLLFSQKTKARVLVRKGYRCHPGSPQLGPHRQAPSAMSTLRCRHLSTRE